MKLYLNGYYIELSADVIAQTLQINDIAELKDRQSNFTNRFKIPRTPNNVKVMNMLGIPGNKSDRPYNRVSAKLVDNGIELVSNGYAVIQSTDKYYNCVIYDGNIKLTEVLKGKKINELDYSDLNHNIDFNSFINSLDNTSGYIHAFADYGRMKGSVFVAEYNPGALFISTLWDKIFTEVGLTYSGNIFSNQKFLDTVVTPTKGYEVNMEPDSSTSLGSFNTNVIFHKVAMDVNGALIEEYFIFTGSASQIINNTNDLEFDYDGLCKINIGSNISVEGGTAYITVELNGTVVRLINEDEPQVTITLIVKDGDKLKLKLTAIGEPEDNGGGNYGYLIVSANASLNLNEIEISTPVDYSQIMPDTLQMDFVKDIMQRFGLMFRKRRNENHFEFIEIQELLNDKSGAEDWSNKYISSSELYKVGSYAQSNKMAYKYDNDANPFADGNMIVNIDVLQKEKTLFTSIFNASTSNSKIQNVPIYDVPLWEENKDDNDNIIYEPVETSFRIFEIVRRQMTLNLGIEISVNSKGISLTNGIPLLDFRPCFFDNYINQFYRSFKSLLDKSKKVPAFIQLDPIDVYFIDFFKLKYIEQLGTYFYLNKINSFKSGKPTKCELIEIGEFYYNSPPTVLGTNQKNIDHAATYTFAWNDFINDTTPPYYDPDGDAATHIKITQMFDLATLKLNGVAVNIGDEIEKSDVDAGLLQATADSSHNESFFTNMKYKVKSDGCDFYSMVEGTFILEVNEVIPSPPVVNAGPDKVVFLPDNSTTLTGTATDSDGIDNVLWTKISGGVASIISPTSLTTDIDNLELGNYVFRLTATDNQGYSSSDDVVVKHWTRYTEISRDNPTPQPTTNYEVTVNGEPFAQVELQITTDEHASGFVGGTRIQANSTRIIQKILDDNGQIILDVEVTAETGYVGNMNIEITAISKGIIGSNSVVTCIADAS